jgi:hypothetical protein
MMVLRLVHMCLQVPMNGRRCGGSLDHCFLLTELLFRYQCSLSMPCVATYKPATDIPSTESAAVLASLWQLPSAAAITALLLLSVSDTHITDGVACPLSNAEQFSSQQQRRDACHA